MMQSLFVALAVIGAPASASQEPHSPHVEEWKAGDAVMSLELSALPEITGFFLTFRPTESEVNLGVKADPVAVGYYSCITNKMGQHSYLTAGIGERFAPGDFLKFIPADGIAPARMIWIDPNGVLDGGSYIIKAEN